MLKLPLQVNKGHWSLQVISQEDHEALKEFGANQVVTAKLTGFKKPRSLQQLNLYWAICTYVAQQLSNHEQQYTKEDIDFQTKIRVMKQNPAMIKRFKFTDGIMYIEPISISFANMDHLTACDYFNKAWPVMAHMIGADADTLLENHLIGIDPDKFEGKDQ